MRIDLDNFELSFSTRRTLPEKKNVTIGNYSLESNLCELHLRNSNDHRKKTHQIKTLK